MTEACYSRGLCYPAWRIIRSTRRCRSRRPRGSTGIIWDRAMVGTDAVGMNEVELALLVGTPLEIAEVGAVGMNDVELAVLPGASLETAEVGAVGISEVELPLLVGTPLETEVGAVGMKDVDGHERCLVGPASRSSQLKSERQQRSSAHGRSRGGRHQRCADELGAVGISEVELALLLGTPLDTAEEAEAVGIIEVELALLLGAPLEVEEMGAVGTREVEFALLLGTPLDTPEEAEAVGMNDVEFALKDGKPEAVLLAATVESQYRLDRRQTRSSFRCSRRAVGRNGLAVSVQDSRAILSAQAGLAGRLWARSRAGRTRSSSRKSWVRCRYGGVCAIRGHARASGTANDFRMRVPRRINRSCARLGAYRRVSGVLGRRGSCRRNSDRVDRDGATCGCRNRESTLVSRSHGGNRCLVAREGDIAICVRASRRKSRRVSRNDIGDSRGAVARHVSRCSATVRRTSLRSRDGKRQSGQVGASNGRSQVSMLSVEGEFSLYETPSASLIAEEPELVGDAGTVVGARHVLATRSVSRCRWVNSGVHCLDLGAGHLNSRSRCPLRPITQSRACRRSRNDKSNSCQTCAGDNSGWRTALSRARFLGWAGLSWLSVRSSVCRSAWGNSQSQSSLICRRNSGCLIARAGESLTCRGIFEHGRVNRNVLSLDRHHSQCLSNLQEWASCSSPAFLIAARSSALTVAALVPRPSTIPSRRHWYTSTGPCSQTRSGSVLVPASPRATAPEPILLDLLDVGFDLLQVAIVPPKLTPAGDSRSRASPGQKGQRQSRGLHDGGTR
ncbi:hypothetical protein KC365_g11 [Hortaea werneckii]|nr:hypothetical protein KC365_g11 [Hortaea werneckii]